MHTWKPDAYREAPSPAGVLMAVGMLNGAVYCLLRVHLIARAALGPGFSGGLLLALGLLSVAVATPFILIQWNLKRLLAYSSVEHVGIMAVGVGLGAEAATFGALLHMTYHTLAKPLAFFSAGTIAQLHASSDFDEIGPGTLGRAPVASALFVLAAVIMTGSPPFGLFLSEMTILKAGFAGPHSSPAVFLGCLVLLFCGFFYQVGRMVLGGAARRTGAGARRRAVRRRPSHHARRRNPGRGLGLLSAPRPPGLGPRGVRVVEGGRERRQRDVAAGTARSSTLSRGEARGISWPGRACAAPGDRRPCGRGRSSPRLPLRHGRGARAGLRRPSPVGLGGPCPASCALWAPVGRDAPRFPSIAARHPVANWFEREVMDYFGPTPEGHPNPNRVALHDDWPEGAWALRKDFDDRRPVPRVGGSSVPIGR